MILIGLTGRAGCGKDTVGELLRKTHDFSTVSFARPIKEMVTGLFGFSLEKWDDREWRETVQPGWEVTPRYMAQTLGTEWGRKQIKKSLWVDLVFQDISRMNSPRIAITDLRFENEARKVRTSGGFVVHVYRGNSPHKSNHASEQGVKPDLFSDFHINNFGTLRELEDNVSKTVKEIEECHEAIQSYYADSARTHYQGS